MKIVTGKPLCVSELVFLTGRDALATMKDNKVRIMCASEGQEIEVDKVVEWEGYTFGLEEIDPYNTYRVQSGNSISRYKVRNKSYDYLAYKL